MPATHHSSAPPTPTTGTPPISPKDTAGPPATPETPSPAPETSSPARSTAPEQPSGPGPTAHDSPAAKGGPAPGKHSGTGEPAPGTPPGTEPYGETRPHRPSPANLDRTPAPPRPRRSRNRPRPRRLRRPPSVTSVTEGTAVGRIPVLDVRPLVDWAGAVRRRPWSARPSRSRPPSSARAMTRSPPTSYSATRRAAPAAGRRCASWPRAPTAGAPPSRPTRPVAGRTPWRRGATRSAPGGTTRGIKIPAGIDTELVLEEGALLYERAAAGVPKKQGQTGRAPGRRRGPPGRRTPGAGPPVGRPHPGGGEGVASVSVAGAGHGESSRWRCWWSGSGPCTGRGTSSSRVRRATV